MTQDSAKNLDFRLVLSHQKKEVPSLGNLGSEVISAFNIKNGASEVTYEVLSQRWDFT